MTTIYIVKPFYDYEGFGDSIAAFFNYEDAYQLQQEIVDWKLRGSDDDEWKEEYKVYYFDKIKIEEVQVK